MSKNIGDSFLEIAIRHTRSNLDTLESVLKGKEDDQRDMRKSLEKRGRVDDAWKCTRRENYLRIQRKRVLELREIFKQEKDSDKLCDICDEVGKLAEKHL
jgi:hypothetical protein